eukprot:scaffold1564_cov389-Prasinococcus_capsulatus_cf.AAC.18
MDALQASIPHLFDAFAMLLIFFMLYGLLGLYFFAGSLDRRCVPLGGSFENVGDGPGGANVGHPEHLSFCSTRDSYEVTDVQRVALAPALLMAATFYRDFPVRARPNSWMTSTSGYI